MHRMNDLSTHRMTCIDVSDQDMQFRLRSAKMGMPGKPNWFLQSAGRAGTSWDLDHRLRQLLRHKKEPSRLTSSKANCPRVKKRRNALVSWRGSLLFDGNLLSLPPSPFFHPHAIEIKELLDGLLETRGRRGRKMLSLKYVNKYLRGFEISKESGALSAWQRHPRGAEIWQKCQDSCPPYRDPTFKGPLDEPGQGLRTISLMMI